MEKEHAQLAALLSAPASHSCGPFTITTGTYAGQSLALLQCGIGKVNAALGAAELIRAFSPAAIVNTGVAGGIDQRLGVMDVVVGRQVAYHDVDCGPECEQGCVQGLPRFFQGEARLLSAAAAVARTAEAEGQHLHEGLICSGDQFITDRTQLAAIKTRYPDALAVDMESGALAQTCHLYAVPFLSFRIISDVVGVENHFSAYLNFWDTMADRSFKVTRALLQALAEVGE